MTDLTAIKHIFTGTEIWIGLASGLLIGSTGAGTGSLMTPLLIIAGYRPAVAISTSLGTLVFSKLTGATLHRLLGHWPDRNTAMVVLGGATGVLLAWSATNWLLHQAPFPDSFLKIILGVVLLLTAASMQFSTHEVHHGLLRDFADKPWLLFVIGAFVASIVATTAAGSGTLLVTALVATTVWRVPQLAAVSNIYGLVVSVLSFVFRLQLGFDLQLFLLIMLGLVPGVIAGAYLSRTISRRWFVRGIGVVTGFLGVRMLFF